MTTFEERLDELIELAAVTDHRSDLPILDFYRWRMRALWLLIQWLGDDHPFTDQFRWAVDCDPDPYSNGLQLIAGKGILLALREEARRGHLDS